MANDGSAMIISADVAFLRCRQDTPLLLRHKPRVEREVDQGKGAGFAKGPRMQRKRVPESSRKAREVLLSGTQWFNVERGRRGERDLTLA